MSHYVADGLQEWPFDLDAEQMMDPALFELGVDSDAFLGSVKKRTALTSGRQTTGERLHMAFARLVRLRRPSAASPVFTTV